MISREKYDRFELYELDQLRFQKIEELRSRLEPAFFDSFFRSYPGRLYIRLHFKLFIYKDHGRFEEYLKCRKESLRDDFLACRDGGRQ